MGIHMKEELEKRLRELKDIYGNVFDEKTDMVAARLKMEKIAELLYLFED